MGRFGHEFIEVEFTKEGRLRYTNDSNYRRDQVIRKEVWVHPLVLSEVKKMVVESGLLEEDGKGWPPPDKVGRQELEICIGGRRFIYHLAKLGSLAEVQAVCSEFNRDALNVMYYLVQDIKALVLALVAAHFKVRPI